VKSILIALALVIAALAALWRLYPETLAQLLSGTPLHQQVNTSTPLFQWRDAEGNWQVTDRPPPNGTPYQVRQYPLDANLLPPRPVKD